MAIKHIITGGYPDVNKIVTGGYTPAEITERFPPFTGITSRPATAASMSLPQKTAAVSVAAGTASLDADSNINR